MAKLVRAGKPERFEVFDKAHDRRKKILGIGKFNGRVVTKCKVVRCGDRYETTHFEVIAYGPAEE